MDAVKIALGMIMKSLDSDEGIMRFIDSASKYGHKLDCVIVAYALQLDPRVEKRLSQKVPFFAINIKNPRYCREQFRKRGISAGTTGTLLDSPVSIDTHRGKVPYGFNRTIVTMEAILRGVDILFFADTDVYPAVLKMTPAGLDIEDVDFFGGHLEHINLGAQITTGEYSGYNILPPSTFDGMEDLLIGVQKAEMLDYWKNSETHRCLAVQPPQREPKPCAKILGGNTAVKLSAFSELPPFFSSHYMLGDELFLCRGEDTVLGLGILKSGMVCTDIGLNPMHDTYDSYPTEPDLAGDPVIQQRFYYACTGWVGRNPFLNYIRGAELESVKEFQREHLDRGLRELAAYTSNPMYYSVLRNFDVSWDNLGRYINEYEQILEAWDEFREKSGLA